MNRNNTRPPDAPASGGKDPQSGRTGRRPSLSGGPPPWAPAKAGADSEGDTSGTASTAAASGTGRRPSLSGGMPRWAPAPQKAAEDQGHDEKKKKEEEEVSESTTAEAGKPAEESGVKVSDWLAAAAAGAAPGEVSGRVSGGGGMCPLFVHHSCRPVRVRVHVPCHGGGAVGQHKFSNNNPICCSLPPTHLSESTRLFVFRARHVGYVS